MAWLLDTHALLWALFEPEKLGRRTRAILKDPRNEVLVNPLSYWEIDLKFGLGKLVLPDTDPLETPAAAKRCGLIEGPLDPEILSPFTNSPTPRTTGIRSTGYSSGMPSTANTRC